MLEFSGPFRVLQNLTEEGNQEALKATPVVRMRTHDDAILADLKTAVRAVAPESFVGATWWSDSISSITAYRNPRFQTIVLGARPARAGADVSRNFRRCELRRHQSHARNGHQTCDRRFTASLIGFDLKGALTPVLMGLTTGILAIRWISPLAEAQLFKVDTHDPTHADSLGCDGCLA